MYFSIAKYTYNLLGVLYWENRKYNDALKQLKKAEEIADLKNLIYIKELVYHNIGLVYKEKKDYVKAIHFLNKSINLKINNSKKYIISSYYSMIDCYINQDKTDEAKELLNTAYYYCKDEKDHHLLNVAKALVKEREGNFRVYINLLTESIKFFEKEKDYIQLKELHEKLGDFYFKNRKYKLAASHFKKQLDLYKKLYD